VDGKAEILKLSGNADNEEFEQEREASRHLAQIFI
jgi:hypothetical protein